MKSVKLVKIQDAKVAVARWWIRRILKWRVRGSVDAFPQDLHVLAGPCDAGEERRVIRVWKWGWKAMGRRDFHMFTSGDVGEPELQAWLEAETQAGEWLMPAGVDSDRRIVNVHTPFRRSPYPDRDAAYLARYFDYHRKSVAGGNE